MSQPEKQSVIGVNIRAYREEVGMSLNQLAERSGISKGYLSALENEEHATRRPSGETLYSVAEALGVTMSDLMGRKLLTEGPGEIPASLKEFAEEAGLPQRDVAMLAAIEFRGEPPRTRERWSYIYNAIRTSADLDRSPRHRR
jgi:transcriptional regulator with XRE-family HTH domain